MDDESHAPSMWVKPMVSPRIDHLTGVPSAGFAQGNGTTWMGEPCVAKT